MQHVEIIFFVKSIEELHFAIDRIGYAILKIVTAVPFFAF